MYEKKLYIQKKRCSVLFFLILMLIITMTGCFKRDAFFVVY